MQKTLDDLTQSEIILNLILLKQGNGNFRVEDLKRGLDSVSSERPRLRISLDSISNTFFFYDHWLHGEFDLPHYRLSREGQTYLQKEFDTYNPELQNRLKGVAEKVWQYSSNS